MTEFGKSFQEERAGFEHAAAARPRDWVDDLIEMTRPGVEMEFAPDVSTPDAPVFAYDDFD
jgi:hypothetical protein